MTDTTRIRALIGRLARLDAAGDWQDGLNPAQHAALAYLARANQFSRSPSHLADYLSATRGTVSQTLKALQRKGLVAEERSARDKRVVSYNLTALGRTLLPGHSPVEQGLATAPDLAATLERDLEQLLFRSVTGSRGATFGLCHTCRHHRTAHEGRFCALLKVALAEPEAEQICHEHEPALAI